MSRVVSFEIDRCADCPNLNRQPYLTPWCELADKPVVGAAVRYSFPAWCPLPEKEESK
jgi:hypothetical protein